MALKKRAARYFFSFFFICFLLASRSSALPNAPARDLSSAKIEWKALEGFPAMQTAQYAERQLVIHCAKIDLTAPGLKIKMLPQKPNSREIFFAEEFSKKSGAVLAINTTPFYVRESGAEKRHSTAGLCINNGKIYSKAISGYCALGFFGFKDGEDSESRRAEIFSSQKDKELDSADFAAGGFWQILKNKKVVQFKELRDSRTAAGLDASGKTLFIIAVEGESPAKSAGLTYMECAEFLSALGCENAMQFDGGSSTQMCVNKKSVLSYKNYVKVPALLGFAFD